MRKIILTLAVAVLQPSLICAQDAVTPLDVYIACHSVAAEGELKAFCKDFLVPTTVRAMTSRERLRWSDSVPSRDVIHNAVGRVRSAGTALSQIRDGLESVHFLTDSATLSPAATEKVIAIARAIAANADIKVSLRGLESATGRAASDGSLSLRRARHVKALLLEHGVLASQIAEPVAEGDERSRALTGGVNPNADTTFQRVDINIQAQPPSVQAAATGSVANPGLSTAAFLNGLTDYLIAEALREVEQQALKRSVARLCGNAEMAEYVRTSCAAFTGALAQEYVPSISRLRGAIRSDLTRMPITLAKKALGADVRSNPKCMLRLSAELYVNMSEGQSPRAALLDAASASAGNCEDQLRSGLQLAASYARQFDDAAVDIGNALHDPRLAQDTAITYAMKALAVNAKSDERVEMLTNATRLIASLNEAQAQWQLVVREINAARADSTKGGNGARMTALMSAAYPAVLELINLAPDSASAVYRAIAEDVRRATTSLAVAQYGDAIGAMTSAARAAGVTASGPLGNLAFAADMAQAGTAEEVTAVLKQYGGSDRGALQKRNGAARYVMVNGYGGLSIGGEITGESSAGVSSLYFPVGIEAGWRLGDAMDDNRRASSLGILIHIIDLGALAAVRIGGSDSLDRTPPPTFASVWAPGALLRVGMGNTRFVGGLGVQYLPVARRESLSGSLRDAMRLVATLAVDVPIFGFR